MDNINQEALIQALQSRRAPLGLGASGQSRIAPQNINLANALTANSLKGGPVANNTEVISRLLQATVGADIRGTEQQRVSDQDEKLNAAIDGLPISEQTKAIYKSFDPRKKTQLVATLFEKLQAQKAGAAENRRKEGRADAKEQRGLLEARKKPFTINEGNKTNTFIINESGKREQIATASRFQARKRIPVQFPDGTVKALIPGSKEMDDAANRGGIPIRVEKQIRAGESPFGAQTKKSRAVVEKELREVKGSLADLNRITSQFDESFLTLPTQLFQMGAALFERGGGTLSDKNRDRLGKFTTFRQTTISALNDYIRAITGAQMSEGEARRLQAAFLSPGGTSFLGLASDSPTEFKSKLDNITSRLEMVAARKHHTLRHGLELTDVSIGSMGGIIRKRRDKLTKEFKAAGTKKENLEKAVRDQLASEFGLISR